MKALLLALFFTCTLIACTKPSGEGKTDTPPPSDNEPVSYAPRDLQKIKWIEGNWKGMDGENAFYEIYRLTNDSTLEIISYNWNGTDSSKTSRSYVAWKEGAHFLGDNMNYKVTSITEDSITMIPYRRAANSILWKKNNDNGWDAVLKTNSVTKEYKMERVNHFDQ